MPPPTGCVLYYDTQGQLLARFRGSTTEERGSFELFQVTLLKVCAYFSVRCHNSE